MSNQPPANSPGEDHSLHAGRLPALDHGLCEKYLRQLQRHAEVCGRRKRYMQEHVPQVALAGTSCQVCRNGSASHKRCTCRPPACASKALMQGHVFISSAPKNEDASSRIIIAACIDGYSFLHLAFSFHNGHDTIASSTPARAFFGAIAKFHPSAAGFREHGVGCLLSDCITALSQR